MKIKIGLIVLAAIFLSACGESTTEQVVEERDAVVSTVAELPACKKSNEGDQVMVEGEKTVRVCVDGKWYSTVGNVQYVQGDAFFCTAEKTADGTGMKILCNGDSVGVVYNGVNGADGENGSDGTDGEQGVQGRKGDNGLPGAQGPKGDDGDKGGLGTAGKNGTGCSIERLNEYSVRVKCGLDSTILYIEDVADTSGNIEPVVLDSEMVAVSLDDISGFSQKGPFLSGSKVRAYEISDGHTLKQTGNVFNGKIANDRGEFKINARTLVSQYLVLEANGFYRNEVTGKNSDAELTLYAITDVSERNAANVNLLTHLEYERVQYLVIHDKKRVYAAKKQAQAEVFNILHIIAKDFANSEDLNIAGNSDGDGALLAFSTLLQGDRSVADLSELLTKIAADMEKDGTWDDATTKILIADWAADVDSAGRLPAIHDNVLHWGLAESVPEFATHVLHFRDVEYGLGDCTSDSVDIVKSVSAGKRKGTKTRYICRDGVWRMASDLEKDTYQWAPGADGEIKVGSITNAQNYLYDSVNTQWRMTTPVEMEFGACIESVAEDATKNMGRYNGVWYKCENRSWDSVSVLVADTQGWTSGEDGEVRGGNYTEANYVYGEIEGSWREANKNDYALELNGCTAKRAGEMERSPVDNRYYRCQEREWTLITDKTLYNTVGYDCDEDGKMVLGVVNTKSYFVCDAGEWREATTDEEFVGGACTLAKAGTFYKDSTYICENRLIRQTTIYDLPVRDWTNPALAYDTLIDDRDGRAYRTIRILAKKESGDEESEEFVVMAENLNYVDNSQNMEGNNWCYNNDSVNCLKGGRYYTWTAAMNLDPKWQETYAPEGAIKTPHQGICPNGWHIPTTEEWTMLMNAWSDNVYALMAIGVPGWEDAPAWKNATNAGGFSVIPTGSFYQSLDDYVNEYETHALYWSASEAEYAYYAGISAQFAAIWGSYGFDVREDGLKSHGRSVRCFKD